MEKKTYKIQGKTLAQGEMTLGQTKRLFELIAEVSGEEIPDIKDIKGIVKWFLKQGLIDRALDIILIGDKDGIVWDELTNTQLEAIVTDFLALNAGWIKNLSGWLRKSKD